MSSLPNRKWDLFSKGACTIGSVHSRIHDGTAYHLVYKSGLIAATASQDVLLQVPANTWVHLRSIAVTSNDAPWDTILYEGPTFSAAGTAVPSYNLRRTSSNLSAVVVTHTPTVSAAGTEIDRRLVPDQTAGAKGAGSIARGEEEEWVLSPNEDYLIRQTNGASAGSAASLLELFWYEPSSDPNVI